jgi:epoxyqueuosine reductase
MDEADSLMTPEGRTRIIKELAAELGFARCGVAAAGEVPRSAYLREWVTSPRAGTMAYLANHLEIRLDPRELMPGARSLVVVAMSYAQEEPSPAPEAEAAASRKAAAPAAAHEVEETTSRNATNRAAVSPSTTDHAAACGRIARYAWGEDYHVVVKERLHALADAIRARIDPEAQYRSCVDTAPIVEREWAARAGVGWIGKNTLVLDPQLGSYFFLGVVVTDLELVPDEPSLDHCGTCTRCLDACPTAAFPAAYEMDASRCISYLTIEHRGEIDPELQADMGDWLFGCDICQEVCPHNRSVPETTEPRFAARPPAPHIDPEAVRQWTEHDYRRLLRGSAMKRAKFDMWQRNAKIVQENQQKRDAGS